VPVVLARITPLSRTPCLIISPKQSFELTVSYETRAT